MVNRWLAGPGLTAAAVARRAGVSASTVHRVRNNKVSPSVGMLRETALACGVNLELAAKPTSDRNAAAATRWMLEDGHQPPADLEVVAWRSRLVRFTDGGGPIETVLWSADVVTVRHLLADANLRPTHRLDKTSVAVLSGEAELFHGSFVDRHIRYAAPIQIIMDCVAQGGRTAQDAIAEAMSW
ncbi:MAG: helix-turn-helix domain-containing protein [Actinomycetia bacterium]|nr:helix-turn-helix domain-containing protein [Actinomycetes bacterium]